MARITKWRAPWCTVSFLAVCVLAGSAFAQRGNGKGGGGGGDGGGSLPAQANVAYNTTGGNVVLLDTVTGETGTLDTDGHAPAWSPDGSQIAYLSDQGYELVIKNSDGSGPVQVVTTVTDRTWGSIDWSRAPTPNGRDMLLYPDLQNETGAWSIFAIGADGTGKVELVADAWGLPQEPRWSPTGDQFIYTRTGVAGTQTLVCTVDMVNGQLAVVASAPLPFVAFECDWSNDGDWIVVAEDNDLWLVDAYDFNNRYQLTFTPNERERWPTFDAIDARIYFMIDDKHDRLYSIDALLGGTPVLESGNRKGIYKPQCRRD